MAENTPPEADHIRVTNHLATAVDSRRAADLFARILRAVCEQTREEQEKKSGQSAA